jgi:hypothetical protein
VEEDVLRPRTREPYVGDAVAFSLMSVTVAKISKCAEWMPTSMKLLQHGICHIRRVF